jgi:hypothetical protein
VICLAILLEELKILAEKNKELKGFRSNYTKLLNFLTKKIYGAFSLYDPSS